MTKNELKVGQAVKLTGESLQRAVAALGGTDFVVSDLFDRVRYNKPEMIAVKVAGRGLALGVKLADVR